jgi:hypothetical protein
MIDRDYMRHMNESEGGEQEREPVLEEDGRQKQSEWRRLCLSQSDVEFMRSFNIEDAGVKLSGTQRSVRGAKYSDACIFICRVMFTRTANRLAQPGTLQANAEDAHRKCERKRLRFLLVCNSVM